MPKDKTRSEPTGLPIIHPFAAGIDIGSRFHVVAVSPDLYDEPVQTFQAFTNDLQRMAALAGGHRYQNRGDGVDRGLLGCRLRSA